MLRKFLSVVPPSARIVSRGLVSRLNGFEFNKQFSTKVYVGNIPYRLSEVDVVSMFSNCGEIVHVKIIKDNLTQLSKGYGFVEFIEPEAAEEALKLTGTNVSGRSLVVKPAVMNPDETKKSSFTQLPPQPPSLRTISSKSKIYVGNLSYTKTEGDVADMFQACGTIQSINIVRDKHAGNRSKGYGFIEFDSDESAEIALQLNGAVIDGRNVVVKESMDGKASTSSDIPMTLNDTIYVANLPENFDEEILEQMFSHCGEIRHIRISQSPDFARTFAHVQFESNESADEAVTLSGAAYDGATILVNYATRRKHTK